jgi:hypothetical protein
MGTQPSETNVRERLSAAKSALGRERRRTADELEALERFESRVRAIDPERGAAGTRRTVDTEAAKRVDGLDRVREAYEATLMSVPHYAEEYDDTYTESLAGEFSPDIAAALTAGTAFDARRKRTLLSAVTAAQSARESLLDVVDRERDSIDEATETLPSIADELAELQSVDFEAEPFGSLDAHRARLGVVERKCETLSERRQREIFGQRRIQRLPTDAADIAVYLYQDLEVSYPVVSLIAELSGTIGELQTRVERAMVLTA